MNSSSPHGRERSKNGDSGIAACQHGEENLGVTASSSLVSVGGPRGCVMHTCFGRNARRVYGTQGAGGWWIRPTA